MLYTIAIVAAVVALIGWSLCVAAGRADERARYK